jgi:hypothetical protein
MTTKTKLPQSHSDRSSKLAKPSRKPSLKKQPQRQSSQASLKSLQTTLLKTQRMVAETREQMAFMYGVLEEIAQRQEIQTSWQINLAKQMFAPVVTVAKGTPAPGASQGSGDFVAAEVEFTTEIAPGEGIPPSLAAEITTATEKVLNSLTEKRKKAKARGIQMVQQILSEGQTKDDKPELKVMIFPHKDEIH